ncbi:MAG TPA: 30S ribosomal protein S7 [Candidatus Paceibacterota bacterium]|nr:30S ribosomal protein S7 [Candidatus Paceibacterota bacterium]
MRRPIKRRHLPEPDSKYASTLVTQLINYCMFDGKKAVATRIVYDALQSLEEKSEKPAMQALEQAIANAGPNMELRSRRVGGANYQVPVEVRPSRRIALALRWVLEASRSAKGKTMDARLAEELLNAFKNEGNAVKKKADMHRMAEANRAFAHLAWGRK